MNIVFITPECFPFTACSTLSETVFFLAKELEKIGNNVKVFMPRYGNVDLDEFKIEKIPKLFSFSLDKTEVISNAYKGILPESLVSTFLIDNQNFFSNSKQVYSSEEEDIKKFNFFSKATIETLNQLDFFPDIVHLFSPYAAGCVDIMQSDFNFSSRRDSIGVIYSLFDESLIKSTNLVSKSKKAMDFSNFIISPSSTESGKLSLGEKSLVIPPIINSKSYNPETDKEIEQTYSSSYFTKGKRACKENLLESCGFNVELNTPLFTSIVDPNRTDLPTLFAKLATIGNLNLSFLLVGYGNNAKNKLNLPSYNENIKVVATDDCIFLRKVLSGSDFFILPDDSSSSYIHGLRAMKYGAIPILDSSSPLRDLIYSSDDEMNGILFENNSNEGILSGMSNALNIYSNRKNFPHIVKNSMSLDINEDKIVQEYLRAYNSSIAAKL